MTLEGWVKKQIERRYPTCWTFDRPKDINVVSCDFMQFVKGQIPDFIKTQKQLIRYFINKILGILDYTNTAIICFDKGSPEVKKIVCHGARYEIRCKQCKITDTFHPECTMGCINKQILKYEDGPHLDINEDASLSFGGNEWMRFASDSRNLHYELYPRIVNSLLNMSLPPGKMLFFSGLPFFTREVSEVSEDFAKGFPFKDKHVILDHWSQATMKNKSLFDFNRVFVFEGGANPREVPEMYNTIHEADNSIFFFSRFFPQHYRHVMFINDGDAISIGLFRVIEDIKGPETFAHEQWICLPYRNKKNKAMLKDPPPFQYLNLTKLCQKIDETPEFIKAGIQSPVATIVWLIIMSGTDFFNKSDFLSGIGGEVIWNTFYEHLEMFSHWVQYYPNVKDPITERRVVIDEELSRVFYRYCIISKYEEACKKKLKEPEVEFKHIVIHCSKFKDPRKRVQCDATMLLWTRQKTWNINYWANAFRDIYIDPFDTYNGLTYFGYTKDLKITNVLASKQKPVDEVHKRHFWKRKQKETAKPIPKISEKKKLAVLTLLRGQ